MSDCITLEELLEQIQRIPAEWLNTVGTEVVQAIPLLTEAVAQPSLDEKLIAVLLEREPYALDVFRLFLDVSQDVVANELNSRGLKGGFPRLRSACARHSREAAEALSALGLIDAIKAHCARRWDLEDVLLERYKQMRGRAIRGQKRGAALEDAVEVILQDLRQESGLAYAAKRSFTNRSGFQAKADFMIPSHQEPRIVIEAKGYEATGSKLTDVLGDILKILQVKDEGTCFFFVTDGVGWYRRLSDLRHIVEHHQRGEIDMIYTRRTLPQLKQAIQQIIAR